MFTMQNRMCTLLHNCINAFIIKNNNYVKQFCLVFRTRLKEPTKSRHKMFYSTQEIALTKTYCLQCRSSVKIRYNYIQYCISKAYEEIQVPDSNDIKTQFPVSV